jgi:DNA-binding transcriptional MerR regulator
MLSIGQMSKVCGVSVKTLRHYEKIGLLMPQKTDELNGYRYYEDSQIGTMLLIGRLKRYGFSLMDIQKLLAITDNRQLQKQMEEHHLVLSEYPNGVKPLAFHFPWRNRILAALGRALIVVAAAPHSGTMLTVNEALACSRPVYCVPHAMDSPCGLGCNLLISQGAFILCEEDDIANI